MRATYPTVYLMDFAHVMPKNSFRIPSFMSISDLIIFDVESVLTARLTQRLENHLLWTDVTSAYALLWSVFWERPLKPQLEDATCSARCCKETVYSLHATIFTLRGCAYSSFTRKDEELASFFVHLFQPWKMASVILSEPDKRTYYGYGMFKFPLHSLCCPFIIRNLLRAFREVIPIKTWQMAVQERNIARFQSILRPLTRI